MADPAATAPVTQRALTRIQAMLRSGAFPPGSSLPPQRRLADELRVSRASLREALSILGTLGIIRVEHGRGTFVAARGDDDPGSEPVPAARRFKGRYSEAEVYQFRCIVEPRAAALAALRLTPGEIGRLEATNRAFARATRELDLVASAEADWEFHDLLMQFSHNRLLVDIYHGYRPVMIESQRLPLARRSRLLEPIGEHEHLLRALGMHDPDGASYYMRMHIGRAADRIGLSFVDVG